MDIIKVSGSSRTSAVAGAIAGVFREHKHAEVQAIGAGAVNQAVKALVLATGYLAGDGLEVVFVPEFVDVEIDGKTRTAIRLIVQRRGEAAAERHRASQQAAEYGDDAPKPDPYTSDLSEDHDAPYASDYDRSPFD